MTTPDICAWWIDEGDDEEAWHITCDRPATHHVSLPGRCKMPLCADHVKTYQSSPEKYTVMELPVFKYKLKRRK